MWFQLTCVVSKHPQCSLISSVLLLESSLRERYTLSNLWQAAGVASWTWGFRIEGVWWSQPRSAVCVCGGIRALQLGEARRELPASRLWQRFGKAVLISESVCHWQGRCPSRHCTHSTVPLCTIYFVYCIVVQDSWLAVPPPWSRRIISMEPPPLYHCATVTTVDQRRNTSAATRVGPWASTRRYLPRSERATGTEVHAHRCWWHLDDTGPD